MLDKALASEFRGQGSNPAARPTCEAGGLTYPVIQVYGRPNSVTGSACALYLQWGLDVLSNERRLAGECVWTAPISPKKAKFFTFWNMHLNT